MVPRATCRVQVRAVAIHGDHAVSGSWDRTARLWSLVTGQCVRVLKHEVQVDILTIYTVSTQYLHDIYAGAVPGAGRPPDPDGRRGGLRVRLGPGQLPRPRLRPGEALPQGAQRHGPRPVLQGGRGQARGQET